MKECLLSLCIPTNGVVEWIIPVIESIYHENLNEDLFEICISDNGNNKEFEKVIGDLIIEHKNINYKKSENKLFANEIDSYKMANGIFVKFVNHRTCFNNGKLKYLLDFVNNNKDKRPLIYFSNGVLEMHNTTYYNSFDDFISTLGIYSTWSTGIAFWREDFINISKNEYNSLFPHTLILFNRIEKREYIIDDTKIFYEPKIVDMRKKGNYDVYYAFLVEFINILNDLLSNKIISNKTFEKLKNDILNFSVELYIDYNILKRQTSFNIANFRNSYNVYFKNEILLFRIVNVFMNKILSLIKRVEKKYFNNIFTINKDTI